MSTVSFEEGFSRDVTNIGHWGCGTVELYLQSSADFEKAKPLIDWAVDENWIWDFLMIDEIEDFIDNLFLSIQTFNSQSFTEKTSPDFYDYITVDESHHAAAPTYQKLLSYY